MEHAVKYRLVPEAMMTSPEVVAQPVNRVEEMRQRIIELLDDPTIEAFEKQAFLEDMMHKFNMFQDQLGVLQRHRDELPQPPIPIVKPRHLEETPKKPKSPERPKRDLVEVIQTMKKRNKKERERLLAEMAQAEDVRTAAETDQPDLQERTSKTGKEPEKPVGKQSRASSASGAPSARRRTRKVKSASELLGNQDGKGRFRVYKWKLS